MKQITLLMLFALVLSAFAGAADQVVLTPGGNFIQDTLWMGIPGRFVISIANDAQLGGISIGFIISSNTDYQFIEATNGFLTNPPGVNFVRGIPGSRWMTGDAPDGSCWDLGGTSITYDPNGSQPNQFLIGGAALTAGLAPGPLEPMLEVYYRIPCFNPGEVKQLCIDSLFYPPAGNFIFVPGGTPAFYVNNSINGCFPVGGMCCCCPMWDDGIPSSMTIHLGDTGQVTLSATDPEGSTVYYYLVGVTGGAGTATVGVDDGIVTYIPDPSDLGQDIQIAVEATDAIHQQGGCLDDVWTVDVLVTDNHPPVINRGCPYHYAAPPNVMTKNDITVNDPDSTDTHTFFISSITPPLAGNLEFDPATAAITFVPVDEDFGMHQMCVGVTDGIDSAECCFTIDVLTADCCPGDMGFNGSVNISDVVFLVNYIFKGGAPPQIMNFADVNADCAVNVADAVYLITYIFRGGPEPQVGCYYE